VVTGISNHRFDRRKEQVPFTRIALCAVALFYLYRRRLKAGSAHDNVALQLGAHLAKRSELTGSGLLYMWS
jgi:hypothetical protein